jgi:hypothetical protein
LFLDGTPTATPTFDPTQRLPDDTIGGNIRDGDSPIPGALVYAPGLVDIAITDKDGAWRIRGVTPPKSVVTIKIRSTQLENSGFDIPAQAGTSVNIQSARTRDYNPEKCPEKDHLSALYNAARRIRFIYRLAATDQAVLVDKMRSAGAKQASGRALSRAFFHASLYFELSAQLPDRQLLCGQARAQCSPSDLRQVRRQMRQSLTQLRYESLLFNRRLRQEGFRKESASKTRICTIRSSFRRALGLIKRLPDATFECSRASALKQTSQQMGSLRAPRQ